MKILYGHDFKLEENTAVAIGKFDGLHEGHKAVLDALLNEASENNLKSVVYTFMKNPLEVLSKQKISTIMRNEDKELFLRESGIDYLIYEEFDENFAQISYNDFMRDILKEKLSAKVIIMGSNSTFGKNREGTTKTAKIAGERYGIRVCEVDLVRRNGKIISSTDIRRELAEPPEI